MLDKKEFYEIKKQGAYYVVITKHSGIVQFKSLSRIFCKEWKHENDKGIYKEIEKVS